MNFKKTLRILPLIALLVGAMLFSISREKRTPRHFEFLTKDTTKLEIEDEVRVGMGAIKKIEAQNLSKPTKEQVQIATKRAYTEAEIIQMTETEFKNVLSETMIFLPKIHEIKKLPNNVLHTTPNEILAAGQDFGLIKEILKYHPEFQELANEFYSKNALNQELPVSLRAQALTHLVLALKTEGRDILQNDYPPEVIRLVKLVIDL